jgi:serine/threonine protein kinase
LKPDNVLSSGDAENEVVKVTNFGFSKLFADTDPDVDSMIYVAPEILQNTSVVKPEPPVDMWALGIFLFTL